MLDSVLFVAHLVTIAALVIVILLQRNAGGLGGLGGGAGSIMTASSSGNVLSRMTAILAATFMILSLVMAMRASGTGVSESVVDSIETPKEITAPAIPEPVTAPKSE